MIVKGEKQKMNEPEKQELIWREVMGEMAIFEYGEWINPRLGLGSTEYAKSRANSSICCPSCFESVRVSFTQCPECGLTLDVSMLETLRDNAFELAVYAWNYRKRYEKDIEKDKIYKGGAATKYYLAPPEDWLVYLASIVFAAILGGLSYDTFKKILSKISSSFRKRFNKEIPRGRWQKDFYDYLMEYSDGKSDPESPIFRAYFKGLIQSSRLRAIFERSPHFETNLMETIRNIKKDSDNENIELELPDSSNTEEPSEDEIKHHLQEIVQQHAKANISVKLLKKYLSELDRGNS